ncbi:MAG: P-II family nitrogen regulator [Dehalococcoidia bacterium]|nr:P-II family nitrogen regulator [Chloroflexota bacterium]MDE2933230.1 P-II family nitrogen regulator [Chloroflexota bacterium]MXX19478.1 P-II family nitrogen regulator [Dehalococcoidia bacterium]MXY71668.1 P-II family nitrogen regulator [Dehalococcoidia bacterium]MYD28983.1 P-II family nitrogen regulator [Dehalococcoidia bacterium]
MKMALVVALVSDEKTDHIIEAAREGGATGDTIISSVRGEGLKPRKTFLGLDLTARRDVVLFLVAEPRARDILERIAVAGGMDQESGAGVAFQITIEDAVGLSTQLPTLMEELEGAL